MSCQRDLFEVAICAREDKTGILPEVLTIDREEFRRLLSEPVDSKEEVSTKEEAWTKAYQLLGLLPDKVSMEDAISEDLSDEIVGFYSSETEFLVLIDDGVPMDSVQINLTLIHEFIHALQDQTVGLDAFGEELRKTTDGAIARQALIEGEAVHFTVVAKSLMASEAPEAFEWDDYYDDVFNSMMKDIENAKVPFATAFSSLPYLVGGPYVTDAYLLNGDLPKTALFDHPITTTVEWMLGYDNSLFAIGSLSCALPQAPEDAEQLDRDRLGAVGVIALLVENNMTISSAWELAENWRWDEIAVYGSKRETDQSTFVAWRTVWESEDDASDFANALIEEGFIASNRSVELDEREVLIVASDQPAELLTWMENADCVAPEDAQEYEQPTGMRKKILPMYAFKPQTSWRPISP